MKKIICLSLIGFALCLIPGCDKQSHKHDHDKKDDHVHDKKDDHDHDHDKKDDHKDDKKETAAPPGKGFSLTSEQRRLIGLETAKAATGQLDNTLRLDGEVRYNLEKMAKVMPRLPGFVSQINAVEGQKVKKGEILAVLQSQKLGELYSDYNAYKELEKLNLSEYRIAERLREKNVMSEIDYLKAKRQYADSQIGRRKVEAILRSLELDPEHTVHEAHLNEEKSATVCTQYEMSSPLDGMVIARDITPGENYAEDNTKPSFIIADTSQLWLELRARQEELPYLSVGQEVTADLGHGFSSYRGKVTYVAPALDEATRTAMVRVLLDNFDGKLKPGLFAVGSVSLGKSGHSVLIPRHAVQMIEGESMVFVPENGGYASRSVKTGRADRDYYEIVSGLKEGEEYVTKGAFELKSMMVTAGMDPHAGHGH